GVSLTDDSGALSSDKITNDPTLSLTGVEAAPGTKVEYSIDSGTSWSTTAPTIATLTQGLDTVQVRQTDVAGNVSAATSFSFTLDTVAPAAPGVSLTDDSGALSSDKITNDPTLSPYGVEEA